MSGKQKRQGSSTRTVVEGHKEVLPICAEFHVHPPSGPNLLKVDGSSPGVWIVLYRFSKSGLREACAVWDPSSTALRGQYKASVLWNPSALCW